MKIEQKSTTFLSLENPSLDCAMDLSQNELRNDYDDDDDEVAQFVSDR
jgi:hypothetical protein